MIWIDGTTQSIKTPGYMTGFQMQSGLALIKNIQKFNFKQFSCCFFYCCLFPEFLAKKKKKPKPKHANQNEHEYLTFQTMLKLIKRRFPKW